MRWRFGSLAATVSAIALSATLIAATGDSDSPEQTNSPAVSINGPQPPIPPAVLTRDDQGHATMRAVRIDQPLKIDGRLDEAVYGDVLAAGDFIQMEPHGGEPETEKTEAWVFFDAENIYVTARCWDDHPERWVATELRRDHDNLFQNENFTVVFDTFHDHRNGFLFQTTPTGAIGDQAFTDEGNPNPSWNTVWAVKAGRFDHGWTVEMAIPFKSLRYRESGPQIWGIQFQRIVRWRNETTLLTRVPAAYGANAPFRMSVAATLVGLETPVQSLNLELKPYVTSALTTDHSVASPYSNRVSRNAGFDVKYGLTRSLIADATYRTDFAQVEEDLQQVNLTRFSLFFPEKRDFFLEGQGLFAFGGMGRDDVPILFFSRQIGLSQGQSVPVIVGGRLTGTVGKFGVGLLNIQTDAAPSAGAVATNFSVVRLKRNVLRRSTIGMIATRRAPAMSDTRSNVVAGVDGNFAFFQNITINTYYATTRTPGLVGSSYQGKFDYAADRYGLMVEHVLVGERFNPQIGFLSRGDFRRTAIHGRFSPRPKSSRLIRQWNWFGNYTYITNAKRTLVENRTGLGQFLMSFNNGDAWSLVYAREFEYIPASFQIAPNVTVPVGGYNYDTIRTFYSFGQQHKLSGLLNVATGTFYGGRRTEAIFTSGRVSLSTRVNIEPGITLNWVTLPQGTFRDELITARMIFTPSPRSLLSSLFQYNQLNHTLSSSVRLRWEYTGGSELFAVYSDGRNTSSAAVPHLLNRSFAIKVTRLLRF